MPMFVVNWNKDPKERNPRASHWWVCNGVITYTSGKLKDWEGGDHKCLVRYLHRRGYTITCLNNECVPNTQRYHRELLCSVEALLTLLESQSDGKPKQP